MLKNISAVGLDCVGCGNCQLACPKHAISLKADWEGFLYPVVIVEKCINCGLCLDNCPQQQTALSFIDPKGYIAISTDKEIYKNAASGGIFGSIAKSFLEVENSYVCGAAFSDGVVKHIIIENKTDVSILQNSKYVQSYLGNVFVQIREILKNGSRVLFSGTPCQVKALCTFIGDSNNLYTIDVVCHGVPSPAFLHKDLSYYKEQDTINAVLFRKKHRLYKSKSSFFLTIKKNREKVTSVPYNHDPYFNMFMEGKTFRYSCYNCHYANLNRVGDITLGDCDSASEYPHFHADEATSLVLINSPKGHELFSTCGNSIEFSDLNIQKECSYNHQLMHPFKKPQERDMIYKFINELDMKQIRNKYAKPYTIKGCVYQILNMILPRKAVLMLLRLTHKE